MSVPPNLIIISEFSLIVCNRLGEKLTPSTLNLLDDDDDEDDEEENPFDTRYDRSPEIEPLVSKIQPTFYNSHCYSGK